MIFETFKTPLGNWFGPKYKCKVSIYMDARVLLSSEPNLWFSLNYLSFLYISKGNPEILRGLKNYRWIWCFGFMFRLICICICIWILCFGSKYMDPVNFSFSGTRRIYFWVWLWQIRPLKTLSVLVNSNYILPSL